MGQALQRKRLVLWPRPSICVRPRNPPIQIAIALPVILKAVNQTRAQLKEPISAYSLPLHTTILTLILFEISA